MDARGLAASTLLLLLLAPAASALDEAQLVHVTRTAQLQVAAVGQREDGSFFGVLSGLRLAAQSPGMGDVFVRTQPLAEVDMQGAARLAVEAAGELTGRNVDAWDYFFTITTSSPIIGGPSAGGALAIATVAVLMNWTLDPDVAMTGMINPDLSIGLVGGVLYKAEAAAKAGLHTFLIPAGERIQYTVVDGERRAVDVAEKARDEWDLRVVEVEDLYDALPYFTGYAAQRPSTRVDPSRQGAYASIMAEVSRFQVDQAEERAADVREALDRMPSDAGAQDRDAVRASRDAAEGTVALANNATRDERYYQASSFAFQSLVQSRYGLAVAGFYDQNASASAYTDSFIRAGENELENATRAAPKPYPLTMGEVGAQAALELRLQEAADLLEEARANAQEGELSEALRGASFARERVGSAQWWSVLRDRVAPLGPLANVDEVGVRALADEYGASATLMLAYAERVLGSTESDRLASAAQNVDEARRALQDAAPAGGLFALVSSMSKVNAAMAALNPPDALDQRLQTLRERTAYDISAARAAGVEPVFALSLFEFAETQTSSDPLSAYETLSFARMAVRTTLRAGGYSSPAPDFQPVGDPRSVAERILDGTAWAVAFLVGLPVLVALVLALLAASAGSGHRKTS